MRQLFTFVLPLVLVAAIATPFAAGGTVTKRVVRIDVVGAPQGGNPNGGGGKFVLRAIGLSDHGTDSYSFDNGVGTVTLTGKRGMVMLRLKARPSGLHVDSEGLDLWTGTWTITGGTDAYESAHGVGAYVGVVGPSYKLALHLEGFLT